MPKITGTGRRLLLAFLALIVFFSIASSVALTGLTKVRDAFGRAGENAEGLRLALELATAVRDQYAHQAHTIILGTGEHVHLYHGAHAQVLAGVAALSKHTRTPDEAAWVREIAASSKELDVLFQERVLPAVTAQDRDAVARYHAQVLDLVTAIERTTGSLAEHFEAAIQEDRAYAAKVERQVFYSSLAFLVAAPFLAALIGLYVGRTVTRPVGILHAGAERLSRGDMATRIDIRSKDEFGALATQFNAMTEALDRHQRAMVESERLASVGRLAAGVAHEINNPLGVILGYVRILKKKGDAELLRDLAVIEEETLRCKEIVGGLLDLSRTPKIEHSRVDLKELAEHTAERAVGTLGARVQIEGDAAVDGDPVKLGQVVFNLVKNAVEAAGPNAEIRIDIGQAGGFATLAVTDTGPGIDAAVKERIFEPFVTTKRAGTGLGLSVCKSIAQAHGGDLSVTSAPGATTFTLRVPAQGGAA